MGVWTGASVSRTRWQPASAGKFRELAPPEKPPVLVVLGQKPGEGGLLPTMTCEQAPPISMNWVAGQNKCTGHHSL